MSTTKQRLTLLNAATRDRRRIRGFSLLELMFALAALGIVTAIAVPTYSASVTKAQNNKAIGDIGSLQLKIAQFELAEGRLPTGLNEIGQGGLLDPWGNPYQYVDFTGRAGNGFKRKDRALNPLNSDYDLSSKGEDGQTQLSLRPPESHDDIIRAGNGSFIGKAENF